MISMNLRGEMSLRNLMVLLLLLSALLILLIPIAYASDSWKEPYPGLRYRLDLNKQSYHPGEQIIVTIEIINDARVTITTLGGYIKLKDPNDRVLFEYQVPSGLSLKPGQRVGPITQPIWTIPEDMKPGVYSAIVLVKTNLTDFIEGVSFSIKPPRSSSSISLRLSSQSLSEGELRPPIPNASINLWISSDGKMWNKITELLTDAEGRFSYELKLENGSYIVKASWSGNEKYLDCSSNLLPVSVGGSPLYVIIEKTVTVTSTASSFDHYERIGSMFSASLRFSPHWIYMLPLFFIGFGFGLICSIIMRSRSGAISRSKAMPITITISTSLSLIATAILLLGYSPLTAGIRLLESFGMRDLATLVIFLYLLILSSTILGAVTGTLMLHERMRNRSRPLLES